MVKNATKSDMWVEANSFILFWCRVEEIFLSWLTRKLDIDKKTLDGFLEKWEERVNLKHWRGVVIDKRLRSKIRADRENSEHVQQAKRYGWVARTISQ